MTDFNVQPIAITGKKETNVYEERQYPLLIDRKETSMAVDHILFNKLKWFNVADNADLITAGSQKFVKSYIGRKATAGAVVACYETESEGMRYFIQGAQVNVGDTVTNQVIDKNNEIWLSVDNREFLGAHPRPFFKLSNFLSNGGKLS